MKLPPIPPLPLIPEKPEYRVYWIDWIESYGKAVREECAKLVDDFAQDDWAQANGVAAEWLENAAAAIRSED